jgi:hypothetical protein
VDDDPLGFIFVCYKRECLKVRSLERRLALPWARRKVASALGRRTAAALPSGRRKLQLLHKTGARSTAFTDQGVLRGD